MTPISVTIDRQDQPVGIVSLVGEHDAYSAGRIANELEVLLESGLPAVVDLSEATFVDSQTLSVLLSGRHQADTSRLGFTIVLSDGDFTQVHRILRMTGLGSWFATYPTLPKALAGARAGHTSGDRLKVA
ncbi:MAG: STAS domain-containing protein [Gaiellaceae bacterium]